MTQPLRIVIFGAGMVGNYLGGRLHPHAHVRLIVRPRMAAILQESGLTVSDLYGYHHHLAPSSITLAAHAEAARDADVVLVTVKSAATVDAAHALAEVLAPRTPVISFQNGIHNVAELRAALPNHPVLAGMVPFNITQPQAGHFHQGSSGRLTVERSPALEPLLPVFAACGLPLLQHDDMQTVMWAKLLINLNNPLNALSGLPLRDELAHHTWRRCLALLQREALRALDAAGIRPAQITALPARWLPTVLSLPDALFNRMAARMLAIDPWARSSTWDDLQAGRRTEVDYINGEIVALAASKGLRAPANARIVSLLREAERTYAPWEPGALWETLHRAPLMAVSGRDAAGAARLSGGIVDMSDFSTHDGEYRGVPITVIYPGFTFAVLLAVLAFSVAVLLALAGTLRRFLARGVLFRAGGLLRCGNFGLRSGITQ